MNNLKDYKNSKKAKVIIEELEKIDQILEITQYSLKKYHHYIPVVEILSVIKNNKTMLKIFKKKNQEIIDNLKKEE